MNNLLLICGSILLGAFLFIKFLKNYVISSRRKEFKDWRVGDIVTLKDGSNIRVVAWSVDGIFFRNIENIIARIDWTEFKHNLSAVWRRHYEQCIKDMNVRPAFTPELKEITENKPDTILVYGKPIDTLTDTECQVYLKMALQEENYELAELLKKKLNKNI